LFYTNLLSKMKTFLFFISFAFFVLSSPYLIKAQDRGIYFETGLTWDQICKKAKTENKFIFVDYYATWCGPCKRMEKEVFSETLVGSAINNTFISVRVQTDTSKIDSESIRSWYEQAHQMQLDFKLEAFPTFLFFSPQGTLLRREIGYHGTDEFLKIISYVTDSSKQYYILRESYRNGQKDYSQFPFLANQVKEIEGRDSALVIAADYINNYLDRLPDGEFLTKTNIRFMQSYSQIVGSKNRIFDYFYNHSNLVDSVMQQSGYSQRFVNYIITKEEIDPKVKSAKDNGSAMDWKQITSTIQTKYGRKYVEPNLLAAQASWYEYTKRWNDYARSSIKYYFDVLGIENFPKDLFGLVRLNTVAWNIFLHVKNRHYLHEAIRFVDAVLQIDPKIAGVIDTKANLLYKLGLTEQAIIMENKALELAPDSNGFKETLKKMQSGQPTWAE
jgi:thioredoxin-related protein